MVAEKARVVRPVGKDGKKRLGTVGKRKGVTVRDVSAWKWIKATAQYLKQADLFVPRCADIVKTSHGRERAPQNSDWYYIRAAAVLRAIYLRPGTGYGGLSKRFGNKKNRGSQPEITTRAARGLLHWACKSLTKMSLVTKGKESGHIITNEGRRCADAIAFNVLLSFFSFVVLIGSFLLNIIHWRQGYETLYLILRSLVPKDSAQIFWSLDRVTQGPGGRATIISFALLIFSSLGIFQPIEMALNRAWGFRERELLRQYLLYIGLTIGCALVLLGLIAFGSLFNMALDLLSVGIETRAWVFRYIGPVISLPFIFILIFSIYYFVPNGRYEPGQLIFTSVAMAILWVLMTILFRAVMPVFGFEESYNRLAPLMARAVAAAKRRAGELSG